MKVAIHTYKHDKFSPQWDLKWISYCEDNNIPYIKVNCYSSAIISILKDNAVTHLLWHFSHANPTDLMMARNVLFSAKSLGIQAYPNFETSWHFDDKVSQKYILEAVGAKMVKSWVFYEKDIALDWFRTQEFPVVVKLRRGSGSHNVKLLKSFEEASKYCNTMFGSGISPVKRYLSDASTQIKLTKSVSVLMRKVKKLPDYIARIYSGKRGFPNEQGYVYVQEFIKNNKHDIRVVVVGDKIWAYKREVRDGDFRASGSGKIEFSPNDIPLEVVLQAYDLTLKLATQSIAFDFIKDGKGNHLLVEMSYGFGTKGIEMSEGYWDKSGKYIAEKCHPVTEVINNLITSKY